MGFLIESIKKYGGADISLCAEGIKLSRYFIPSSIPECSDLSDIPFYSLNRMMNEEGIDSIGFFDGKVVCEVLRTGGEFCVSRASDIGRMRERSPEDYIRIMEIADPKSRTPIYF